MNLLWDLFIAFSRANIFAYGGGPGSITFIRKEVVDIYGWMSNEEFINVLAVGNALPGPIATKLAAYIGYHVGGISGALISIIASIAPTAIMMVMLLAYIMKYKDTKIVKGAMIAIQPVIVVLLLHVAYEVGKDSINNLSILIISMFIISFVTIFYLGIHPALIIILAMIIGSIFSGFII